MAARTAPAATDGIYDRVRADIVHGALRPNQRLVELELAERLGVSRTPIRETLQRLTLEGLVQRTRGGWIVHEHSREEIRSIYEVRAALDGYAAFLAADRATESALDALEALYPAGDAALALDPDTQVELNERFHDGVIAAAGNPRLLQLSRAGRQYTAEPPHRAPVRRRGNARVDRGSSSDPCGTRATGRAGRGVARAGARRLRARDRPDEDHLGKAGRP